MSSQSFLLSHRPFLPKRFSLRCSTSVATRVHIQGVLTSNKVIRGSTTETNILKAFSTVVWHVHWVSTQQIGTYVDLRHQIVYNWCATIISFQILQYSSTGVEVQF